MNGLKLSKSKLLISLVTVCLTLLFTVVVPLHQHKDLSAHDDCAICAISHQPMIAVGAAMVKILFVLLLILVCVVITEKTFTSSELHLRSPPSFN